MKSFSVDHVKLWGHILLNMPIKGNNNFQDFAAFCRNAHSYQGLAILECNQELTPRQKARKKSLEEKMMAYCATVGIVPSFSGDPRGFVVKVRWPDLGEKTPFNTWGGPEDGWGVGLQGRNRGFSPCPLVRRALMRPPRRGQRREDVDRSC